MNPGAGKCSGIFPFPPDMCYPQKVQGLLDAAAAGVSVPPTLFLAEHELSLNTRGQKLDAFFLQHPASHYLIRSCVSVEDRPEKSMAGYFASSGQLTRNQVLSELPGWFNKNKILLHQRDLSGDVNLMLQPFYCASWGGIAFLPWKYYPYHVLIDLTPGGARQAVEGRQSRTALLSLDPDLPDGVPLPDALAAIKPALLAAFEKIRGRLCGAWDIEWLLQENGEVIVVQIRPVTCEVNSFLPATSHHFESANRKCQALHPGVWETGGIGESFGNLSPLSASLFQQLFQDAVPELRTIGIAGGECFFHRLPNGQILSHADSEKIFFSFRKWTGALYFGLREAEIRRRTTVAFPDHSDASFDYERMLEVFILWQMASLYFLHREKGKTTSLPRWNPREYELTILQTVENPKSPQPFTSWDQVRNQLKKRFLFELRKLKLHIVRTPETAFLSWSAYQNLPGPDRGKAGRIHMKDYLTPAHFARYPEQLGGNPTGDSSLICVAGETEAHAPCLVIPDPGSWTDALPDGVIVVAPYFRNEWVPSLPGLAGVILEQGGHLSHSAIEARELKLPYFIRVDKALSKYTSGQQLNLNPKRNTIAPANCMPKPVEGIS